ncbi:MAG: T9SS type A sorting domain-containing protein [Sphingobacteriaceae bacterium]|nr:T9SS type A sorting domain-containing protein [Sphingobacteriaceae bacterium]
MKKIFFGFFLISTFISYAQLPPLQWARSMGGTLGETGYCVINDDQGNVYTTGAFQGAVDFDPGPGSFILTSSGSNDVFVSKLDAAGNFLWAFKLGSTGDDTGETLAIDSNGNLVIAGFFNFTADFDPGPGTFNQTSSGNSDIFVARYSPAGALLMALRIGGTGIDDPYSLKLDALGNIYCTGFFQNTVDFNPGAGVFNLTSLGLKDIFVFKWDMNGNFIWANRIGGTGDEIGYSLALDANANSYITGFFRSTADFDPGPGVFNMSPLASDVFSLKLDASGNFIWAKRFGAVGDEVGYSNAVDNAGDVYITGFFTSNVDFDPGIGVYNMASTGGYEIFVNKLDVNGNFVWAAKMGGTTNDAASSISLDNLGGVYTTGYFSGVADFDPGPGTANLVSGGSNDIFISKLDASNGAYVWAVSSGSVNPDYGAFINMSNNGALYLCGYFQTTVDFDPTVGVNNLTSAGLHDIFVEKFCQAISQPTVISGNTIACAGEVIVYSTNTVVGAQSYYWNLPGGWSGINGNSTISVTIGNSNGTIGVTANAGCSTGGPTLAITVRPSPTITVNSGAICIGDSYTITPSGAVTYTISGGSFVVTPSLTTSYSVIGTNSLGCVSPTPVIVTVSVNPLPTITVNSGSICAGSSFTLIPGGASTYTYSGGSAVVNPTVNTSYSVTGTSSLGCISGSPAIANVSVFPTPTITVNSGSICAGDSFTMNPSGALSYTFSSGSPIVSPSVSTSYSIIGTNAEGCISTSSVISNVTVNPLPIISVPNGSICPGESFTLMPTGAFTYTYSSGSPVVSPLVNTSYSIIGTSTAGCISSGSTVATVSVAPPFTIVVTGTNVVCSGQPLALLASGATSYTWSDGSSNNPTIFTPTSSTTYSVFGHLGSCKDTSTYFVNVNPLPNLLAFTTNSIVCINNPATLVVVGALSYTWNPGGPGASIVVSPSVSTIYSIVGIDVNGCSNVTTITQSVSSCDGIAELIPFHEENIHIYPNPFNDKLYFSFELIRDFKIEIHNSIGQIIFENAYYPKEKMNIEINLSDYAKGIYFFKLTSQGQTCIKKIVKD